MPLILNLKQKGLQKQQERAKPSLYEVKKFPLKEMCVTTADQTSPKE